MKNKKMTVWVFDSKNVFALVEHLISDQVDVKKFENMIEFKKFEKQERDSGRQLKYPDFIFFFPKISIHRVLEIEAMGRFQRMVSEKSPNTISIAFSGVQIVYDQLSRAGFATAMFDGGQTVKDLFNIAEAAN